ncbi:MAG TPA: saccharopine dehydrogenase NADP-binding domain-containing protein, partial [Acidimicrobiales bacterium]
MRVLVVGAGGVGSSMAAIAERRTFFDEFVLADVSVEKADKVVNDLTEKGKFRAAAVDARDREALIALARESRTDVIVNACDPRLNPPIFQAALQAGCSYVDMA